jgi:DNA-directed RNA polymerase specialized sigma24 family protein
VSRYTVPPEDAARTFDEIARELKTSAAAVRVAYSRALKRLREECERRGIRPEDVLPDR